MLDLTGCKEHLEKINQCSISYQQVWEEIQKALREFEVEVRSGAVQSQNDDHYYPITAGGQPVAWFYIT